MAFKIIIGPSSFAETDKTPMKRLIAAGYEVINNPYKRKLIKKELYDDILLLVGGNIFRKDIDVLKEMGVAEVFPTGSDFVDIVNFINTNFRKEIQS